jgi:hypothetical protein
MRNGVMFEWLRNEIAQIKTNKFHVIEGKNNKLASSFPEWLYSLLPPSYVAFESEFGGVQLYRMGSYYKVRVFNVPEIVVSNTDDYLIEFGYFGDCRAYFRLALLIAGGETPVFEWDEEGPEEVATSFEEWLFDRCAHSRSVFREDYWQTILDGPPPFTVAEQAIVAARRQFEWSLSGFNDKGDVRIWVKNGSSMVLPYLTVGVRRKDGPPIGALWLPTAHLKPTEESIVEHSGYSRWLAPENTELYQVPDPAPEDRDRYWEFGKRRISPFKID